MQSGQACRCAAAAGSKISNAWPAHLAACPRARACCDLQVMQQRLEGLGMVFASAAVHHTTAEAWRAVGPLSMARQVRMRGSGALRCSRGLVWLDQ